MWLEETLVGLFGVLPLSQCLGRLPLRVAALLEVATRAGLGIGRTQAAVLGVLRDQSSTILKQWKMMNIMETTVSNNAAVSSLNDVSMVAVMVDIQKDNKELKLVRLIFALF